MIRRPALTILLLTDREALRADFSSGRRLRLLALWRRERPREGRLATAADLANSLGPKVGRRVLVLATSLWTQTVALPAQAVDGLSDEELAQTLKFEVESFSGIGAFESRLAYQVLEPDGQEREFWICQAESGQIASLEDVVAARGGKLIGVGHPAGVPAGLGEQEGWKRLEFWPEVVCCVQGGAQRRLFLSNAEPRSDRWQAALENWQPTDLSPPVTEWLVGPGVAVPDEHLGAGALRLDDPNACERWLLAWARQVEKDQAPVPLLRPAKKAISKRARVTSSILMAGAAAALCAVHLSYLRLSEDSLSRQIEMLKEPAEQKRQLEQQLAAVAKEQKTLDEQLAAVEADHRTIAAARVWRDRLAVLLNQVSSCCSEDLMITELSADAHGLTLAGRSLTADAATRFAARLRPVLAKQGWQVEPPTQEGKVEWVNGGPWEFRVVLREIEPAAELIEKQTDEAVASSPAETTQANRAAREPAF